MSKYSGHDSQGLAVDFRIIDSPNNESERRPSLIRLEFGNTDIPYVLCVAGSGPGLSATGHNYTLVAVAFMPVSAMVVALVALSTIRFLDFRPIDENALRDKFLVVLGRVSPK
jgi:hypothetical protein